MTSEQMLEVVDMKLDEQQRTLYDPVISSFPEGGLLAWLAVTGSFLTLFVASGFVSISKISAYIRIQSLTLNHQTYGYGVFLVCELLVTPLILCSSSILFRVIIQ